MRPKLAIVIPTYSRANDLQATLTMLFAQLTPDHLGKVVICVYDNASSEETGAVCRAYGGEYLRYARRDVTLPVERSIVESLRETDAEWIWLLGDDDVIKPRALQRIWAEIGQADEHRIDYILLNFGYVGEDKTTVLQERVSDEHPDFTGELSAFMRDIQPCFEYMSLISANVFRRDLLDLSEGYETYVSFFAHFAYFTQSFYRRRVRFIAEPLLHQRLGGQRFNVGDESTYDFEPRTFYAFLDLLDHVARVLGLSDGELERIQRKPSLGSVAEVGTISVAASSYQHNVGWALRAGGLGLRETSRLLARVQKMQTRELYDLVTEDAAAALSGRASSVSSHQPQS